MESPKHKDQSQNFTPPTERTAFIPASWSIGMLMENGGLNNWESWEGWMRRGPIIQEDQAGGMADMTELEAGVTEVGSDF